MRSLLFGAAALVLLAGTAHADTQKNCDATWKTMPVAYRDKVSYKTFSAECRRPEFKVKVYAAGISALSSTTPPRPKPEPTPADFVERCLARCDQMNQFAIAECNGTYPGDAQCICEAKESDKFCRALCNGKDYEPALCPNR